MLINPLSSLAQNSADGEVFELSPFEVAATDNGNYLVEDTLAGSRLRSEMKDIGASVTHLSADFIDDFAASDLSEVLGFMPSTEQESTSVNENDFAGVFRAQRFRIRGLFSETISRNYHTSIAGEYMPPADTYNVDRTTLSAGANSILFGAANPAGTINTQTIKPILGKDFQELVHRTDNYGTMRFEYGGNFSLIDDKLAVRVALLEEERELYLDPQWKDQTRIYGAIKWRLTNSTTINANFENMEFVRNAPVATIYKDRADSWRSLGMNTVEIDGTSNPSNAGLGVRSYSGAPRINAILGSLDPAVPVIQSWTNHAVGTNSLSAVTNRNGISNLHLYDPATNLGADWRVDDRHGWIGDLSIEQKITDNFYVQLAYFGFDHKKDIYVGMGNDLFVDASSNLPGIGDNPNAERYFITSERMRKQDFKYDGSNLRLTASYNLDLTDTSKWLGRHQFALMAEDNTGHRYTDRNDLMNTDPATMVNSNVLNANNRIRPIFYVNLDGSPTDVPGQPTDIRSLQAYLNDNGLPGAEWVSTLSGINIETKQEAYLIAAQSHWFNDRLVTTLGYRNDKQDVYDLISGWTKDERGYFTSYRDIDVPRTLNEGVSGVSENSYSIGGVYHLLVDRGEVDYLSLTYNTSTNFTPSTAQRNYQGETIDFSTGRTEDVGIKMEVFERKLSFRLSYFQSSQDRARQPGANNAFIGQAYNDIWEVLADAVDESFRDNLLTQPSDTFDVASKGYEFELNYLPNRNFRIRTTVSKNDAVNSNVNPSSRAYHAENEPFLRSNYGDIEFSATEDINARLDRLDNDFARVIAQEGQKPIELREWSASTMLTYDFRDGVLDGFSLGGYFTWVSEATIGYAQNDDGILDPNMPFEGDSILATGLNLSYRRKFDNFDWRIQLNVRNLLNDDDPIAIRADEAVGSNNEPMYTVYSSVEPRSFILTNTFSF